MILRSLLLTIAGVVAVLVAPLWVQVVLMVLILFLARPAALVLIPAFIADLAYSPGSGTIFPNLLMTAFALLALMCYGILRKKTRLFSMYDFLEKEK